LIIVYILTVEGLCGGCCIRHTGSV